MTFVQPAHIDVRNTDVRLTADVDNTALSVIIGRAGSKGLPGKNSRMLAGRPLITYSIEHAAAALTVSRTVVSTDCPHIAAAAGELNIDVIDRPAALASDTASVASVVEHACSVVGGAEPVVIVLYANVPLRPAGLIDRAVAMLIQCGADSVQSYTPVGKYHPHWMVRVNDEQQISPYVENAVDRRQDLPPLYIPDGGVIAVQRSLLNAATDSDHPHAFLGSTRTAVINEPGAVIDIDNEFDLHLAEVMLSRERTNTPIEQPLPVGTGAP